VNGKGVVNVLAADQLMQSPRLYGTVLLWLLSELFERLPEVGDLDKPKIVFFFDEAHLLFAEAPKVLLEKIEQVVRLIRSKGVGVYFVTQNPLDIPDTVLGQLGNRVQHALRAFTPRDQKAVKAAAQTLRANPGLDVESAIGELGVGEALVSFLDEAGRPNPVHRAWILAPGSRLGPVSPEERTTLLQSSLVAGVYENVLDRQSAYEMLKGVGQAGGAENGVSGHTTTSASTSDANAWGRSPGGGESVPSFPQQQAPTIPTHTTRSRQTQTTRESESGWDVLVKTAVKALGSQVGRQVGQEIVRGVLGSILGGSRRR
jgi:hypothetical protein